MEELRNILGRLTDVESGMDCMENLLNALEEFYEGNQEYLAYANVNVFKRQLSALHNELSSEITSIDKFILNNRKRVTDNAAAL